MTEAESGVRQPQPRRPKYAGSRKLEKARNRFSPLELPEGTSPVVTLILAPLRFISAF